MSYTEVYISPKLRYSYDEEGRSLWFEWLLKNLGVPLRDDKHKWYWDTHETLWFRDAEDATLFILKWM